MPNKTKRYKMKKKHNKSKKTKRLVNRTPYFINELSQNINERYLENKVVKSYSPTVNNELVTLQSVERDKIHNCNNEKAFELKEPLQIGLPGVIYGKTCVPYYDERAVKYLLKNLSANKHVNPEKIVPPVQSQSNCWFNTMVVGLSLIPKEHLEEFYLCNDFSDIVLCV